MTSGDCPAGAVCVWTQTNYQGGRVDLNNQGCFNIEFWSIRNNSTWITARVYPSSDCAGDASASLGPGQEDSSIRGVSVNIQSSVHPT
jgi:Peptidase inhibitor family I36